ADLPAIVDIYNQSIPGGWSMADTTPIRVEDRVEWFRKFDPARRPIWVAEVDGRVVGWVGLSSFYVCVRPTALLPGRAVASGPTGRKGWASAEVKESTQWKRRRSLLRAPVPVLPHAAIGSVNPARRALLSASR